MKTCRGRLQSDLDHDDSGRSAQTWVSPTSTGTWVAAWRDTLVSAWSAPLVSGSRLLFSSSWIAFCARWRRARLSGKRSTEALMRSAAPFAMSRAFRSKPRAARWQIAPQPFSCTQALSA
eukprot:scaffold501_cov355-Pinguiococcus_pyrenoidosus.AAC.26